MSRKLFDRELHRKLLQRHHEHIVMTWEKSSTKNGSGQECKHKERQ